MMRGYFPFGVVICGLLTLLVAVAFVGLLIWALRAWSQRTPSGSARAYSGPVTSQPTATAGDRSLDILRERYARGEITKDEYDRMRQDLSV